MAQIPTDRNLLSPMGNMGVAVAIGAIPGWTSFRKFGMNDAVASGTEEMWPPGTSRVLPTSAGALSVVSDSAEDDENEATPPGTGAWTIVVEGLDSNYEEISETITMTGTTPAASVGTDWFRVNRAYNTQAGTNEINVGNISISIGGDLQAYIEANEGQTHQTHYTVPAGKTLVVDSYTVRVGRMSGSTDLSIQAQVKIPGQTAWRSISDIYLWDGNGHQNIKSVTVLPQTTEIRQRIVTDTSTQCIGIFGGFLVDNSVQGNFG